MNIDIKDFPNDFIRMIEENEKNTIRCRYCDKKIEAPKQFGSFDSEIKNNELKVLDLNIYFCEHCNMPLINLSLENVTRKPNGEEEFNVLDENDIYPISPYIEKFEGDIGKYTEYYEQALSIHELSPKACCVLFRILVEKILKEEFNLDGFTLGEVIKNLKDKYNDIPRDLLKTLYICKDLGNSAAHQGLTDLKDVQDFHENIKKIFQMILIDKVLEP